VKNAKGAADDGAGLVRGGQRAESYRSHNESEEDDAAYPDDDAEKAKDAKQRGHASILTLGKGDGLGKMEPHSRDDQAVAKNGAAGEHNNLLATPFG
jgi:hypothetical protein